MTSRAELEIFQAARLIELQEACGVTPRPRRQLTPEEEKLVDLFRAELQAVTDEMRAAHDEMLAKLHAAAQAERATLARLLSHDDENKRD